MRGNNCERSREKVGAHGGEGGGVLMSLVWPLVLPGLAIAACAAAIAARAATVAAPAPAAACDPRRRARRRARRQGRPGSAAAVQVVLCVGGLVRAIPGGGVLLGGCKLFRGHVVSGGGRGRRGSGGHGSKRPKACDRWGRRRRATGAAGTRCRLFLQAWQRRALNRASALPPSGAAHSLDTRPPHIWAAASRGSATMWRSASTASRTDVATSRRRLRGDPGPCSPTSGPPDAWIRITSSRSRSDTSSSCSCSRNLSPLSIAKSLPEVDTRL
ncbi:MAG: hypothetical protein J3K34DRAFT_427072 [Monoraphidium minutum]|nr:MAG: hypothetical protein J3K34DRAFT_427072 [Monoraphidium minutum]